ncbi:MAG: hypothetical protein IT432_06910 [Phycisphaerales bacterium]|nr:hypothetical protein [Phycisphaerales bacterium]
MASSFKSKNLFGSGPNVFVMGVQGELAPLNISLGIGDAGSTLLGLLELNVTVEGRLVAASESALWALRDAVTAELSHWPTAGTLVDNAGRTWTDMTFISYTETAVSRGRAWSVGYKALFRRMAG